jgi:4-hydroxy-tetrahydrodipicolinate synthase
MELGELVTAMVSPFDRNHNLNLEVAEKLMEHLVKNESDAILLAGTTGESPTLKDEEKMKLFELGVDKFSDKVKIIAGTGSYDTKHSIELSKEAEKIGVDAVLLVTPYYNKPSQMGLFKHFEAIASEIKIPVILYNVPSRTSVNITAKTCIELSKVDNIIGMKEASSDFRQIAEIIRGTKDGFLVYSGNDGDTLPMLSLGAHGVISVAAHIVGKDIKNMIRSFKSGNILEAARLHNWLLDIFYGIFITTSPVPIKEALNLSGINVGPTRLPLCGMTDEELQVFKKILTKYNLIQ